MSPRTSYLSKLVGLYCLVIAVSMMSHKQATVMMVSSIVNNAPLLLVTAILALVAGLAIILSHNVWSGSAPAVVVTLVGWVSFFKGLILLFLTPDSSVAYVNALHYDQFFYFYMSITLVTGAYLTFAGFRSSK